MRRCFREIDEPQNDEWLSPQELDLIQWLRTRHDPKPTKLTSGVRHRKKRDTSHPQHRLLTKEDFRTHYHIAEAERLDGVHYGQGEAGPVDLHHRSRTRENAKASNQSPDGEGHTVATTGENPANNDADSVGDFENSSNSGDESIDLEPAQFMAHKPFQGHAHFAEHNMRLLKCQAGNKFAALLSEVMGYYGQAANKNSTVKPEERTNSDPWQLTIPGPEPLVHLSIPEWLSIEGYSDLDHNYDESWVKDNFLTNAILLNSKEHAQDYFLCDPVTIQTWLPSSFTQQQMRDHLTSALKSIRADKSTVQNQGHDSEFPADHMPKTTRLMVLPFERNHHWSTVVLHPDYHTGHGRVILYNSLSPSPTNEYVKDIMPLFAELVNARPGLQWNQRDWTFEQGKTMLQQNATDCGPITIYNCRQLMLGQLPTVYHKADNVAAFVSEYRLELLQGMKDAFFPATT